MMRKFWKPFCTHVVTLALRIRKIPCGANSAFIGFPVIRRHAGSSLVIGTRFMAISTSRYQVMGVNHSVILKTITRQARLVVGDDCGASGTSIVCAESISIGDGVMFGANSVVVDTDFHPIHALERRYKSLPKPRPEHRIIIGSNVFVGTGAIILKGTTIGDNSVVGAGAVVSGYFPGNSIVAGNPARKIAQVTPS